MQFPNRTLLTLCESCWESFNSTYSPSMTTMESLSIVLRHVRESRSELLTEYLQLAGENQCTDYAAGGARKQGVLDSYSVCNASGNQASERHDTHERHSIETHDPAALVLVDDGLDDGIAGCDLRHHAKAGGKEADYRKGEASGESERGNP